jgi:mannose-6-phosphate isomerase
MNRSKPYPLLFTPVYKDYPWGGQTLSAAFGRSLPGPIVAESWEIADRPEGMSVVANGPEQGATLGDLMERWGARLVGERGERVAGQTGGKRPRFPLLFKIIDACERLSLQVHPSDESASRTGGEPKSEMWYVLGAAGQARVLVGLRPGIDRPAFERALAEGRIEARLCSVPVRPGSVVPVPGGQPHAIDAGCLLYEIQQSSDTTFRLHDWGRLGADRRPRALHVREALEAIAWNEPPPAPAIPRELPPVPGARVWDLLRTPHFHVRRLELAGHFHTENDGESFHALFLVRGAASVEGGGIALPMAPGTSCLLPAALRAYTLLPEGDGPVECLWTSL